VFNGLDKMKSFSLDIPVLKETIAQLEIRIKNIEKIGTDAHDIGNRLVSESWEGQATKSFIEHNQNWKKGYDETVNQLMDFKESLEKVVLAGAEEINEMALELAMPLGGSKGTGTRNLISMEQEGIEELKVKCKTLVYEDYEEQRGIMGRIESLSSQLNYPFSIGAEAAKNKKTIEENQEKVQTFKTKLQHYEDRVLLFEQQVVDEMSKYAVIGGHKLDGASFREVLQYQKDDNWKALLSKNVEELSDIEKLVLKAEYERGITHKISQYINKRLGIEGIDFKDFTLEDAATILVRQRKLTLGDILDGIDEILNKCEILDSSIELNLGKNIKYVKKFIPVLVPMEKIEQYLKNEEVQQALQKGFQWTIKAAKIVIENSAIDRNLDLINNGMDGLAALIQGKEYTYEHKGVIYSLGQAFDETEKGEDKFAKGNVSGAYLNFEGEALGFLQTVYLNYENNCSSLENGHGFQEFQRKMDYSAFEKQHFERMGKRPVGERLSEKSAVLGFTYRMIMDIGTDPLTYITGEGIAAGIFGKTGKGASIVGKTDDLLKGTKAAGIEIKGAAGELDTVLKQGDNAVKGMLDAKKVAKGSTADDIIEGGLKARTKTNISSEMQQKILEGQRKSLNKNEVIGGHSPTINNKNIDFAVEVLSKNPDGTKNIQFTKDLLDGNISKLKKSTIFPDSWTESKIIDSIKEVGDSPVISVRSRDGATWHRQIIGGIEIDVIKIGDDVISGYPTGTINAPKPSGF